MSLRRPQAPKAPQCIAWKPKQQQDCMQGVSWLQHSHLWHPVCSQWVSGTSCHICRSLWVAQRWVRCPDAVVRPLRHDSVKLWGTMWRGACHLISGALASRICKKGMVRQAWKMPTIFGKKILLYRWIWTERSHWSLPYPHRRSGPWITSETASPVHSFVARVGSPKLEHVCVCRSSVARWFFHKGSLRSEVCCLYWELSYQHSWPC